MGRYRHYIRLIRTFFLLFLLRTLLIKHKRPSGLGDPSAFVMVMKFILLRTETNKLSDHTFVGLSSSRWRSPSIPQRLIWCQRWRWWFRWRVVCPRATQMGPGENGQNQPRPSARERGNFDEATHQTSHQKKSAPAKFGVEQTKCIVWTVRRYDLLAMLKGKIRQSKSKRPLS